MRVVGTTAVAVLGAATALSLFAWAQAPARSGSDAVAPWRAVLVNLAPDPAGAGARIGGFSRNHWISSRQKMLSPFGGGQGPIGDNSLRLYDPVKNTWEYVWPAGHANGGVQKRDNHNSLYVPALDEFWIWGGSYLGTYGRLVGDPSRQPYRSGRFSFRTNRWVAVSPANDGAFAGVIKDGPAFFATDSANAWSDELDMGVVFGGSTEGNPTDRMGIIERNPVGPERYRWVWFHGPRPPGREQAHNLMVSAGTDFYLYGGVTGPVGRGLYVRDFWKFDGLARRWTRLPDPPSVGDTPAVTYDSALRLVVVWNNDRLYVYSIDGSRWYDVTPPGLPCVGNQMAVYAPTARLHIYEGGGLCDGSGRAFNRVVAIRLTPRGASAEAPAPQPASAPVRATFPSRPVTAPPGLSGSAAQIQLPRRTWVKVPLPPSGQGPCTAPYGCKHVRPAVNLQNGRIYFFGGDYESVAYPSLFSYSIRDNTWAIEYFKCGAPGDVLPWIPDQVSWAYDSQRNLFYWNGGFTWGEQSSSAPRCPASTRRGPSMTFDPATRKWRVSPFGGQPTGGSGKSGQFSVYDPVTDAVIIMALWQGNAGVVTLNLQRNTWEGRTHAVTDNGQYINDGDWAEDNQPAIDVEGRAVYIVDRGPGHGKCRLLRYNIDRKTVTHLGPTPECHSANEDIPLVAWDSVNRLLYWLTRREKRDSVIWAYRPDPRGGVGGTWERLGMLTADGVQARGNLLVFDPLQNALLLMGGVNWHNEPAPSYSKYLFLFRYGPGGD